ncbi:uncharacterized protein CBL_04806 [Carabus blaptoides fortunei]
MNLRIAVILLLCDVNAQLFGPGPLDTYKQYFRSFRSLAFNLLGRTSENPANLRKARQLNILQNEVPVSTPFPCNVTGYRSLQPPTTVDQVRPGDIDIIAAMGDSLTAGYGLVATEVLQVFMENRGLAWSIGGQDTWRKYLTLPNILKEFNPNLIGYSLRDSFSTDRNSQFNPAEGAAISSELPYMTKVLLTRIINDPRVNLKRHWKLITVMIGANNFCLDICYQADLEYVLQEHRRDMIQTFRLLRDNLPRTIVNLVPAPDVTVLKEMTNKPNTCVFTNRIECYCLFANQFVQHVKKYHDIIKRWQQLDEEIANMPEFQQDEFTVIYQPFSLSLKLKENAQNKTDYSYMSRDCFHLSQKYHAESANALWNNMMQKVGQKFDSLQPLFEKFLCPSEEHPYIFTRNNSNL